MLVDIENSAGTRYGDGPIITAQSFEQVNRLDQAGTVRFSMPASDARAALVQGKRRARCRGMLGSAMADLGAGIIDSIAVNVDNQGGATLAVSGDNLMRELTYTHVGALEIGLEGAPATTGPADIEAFFPSGWSLDTVTGHNDTVKAIHQLFEGETCLAALVKLAELTGEHFRLGSGRKIVWMHAADLADSGIRAIQSADPDSIANNADVCLITNLEEVQDTYDSYIGRVYAYGVGNGDSRIDLEGAAMGYAGYTIGSDSRGYYLEHTATWSAYGIERYMTIKDINDADTLAEAVYEWMRRRLAAQKSYKLTVTKLDRQLSPGEMIRAVYHRFVDGYHAININALLYILETTVRVDAGGIRTVAMQVSTADAWPENDEAGALYGSLATAQASYTHAQPVPAGEVSGPITVESAHIGDGTNYTGVATNGEITLHGTARVKREIVVDEVIGVAGAAAPTSALRAIGASGGVMESVRQFSAAAQNDLYVRFHAPTDLDDSVNVTFHLMWLPGSAWTAGNYLWKLEYLVKAKTAASNTGTPTTISADVTPANATDYIETEFATAVDLNADQVLVCHFYRDVAGDNGDDTGDVRFLEIEYTCNKLGE
ncbi:MAG: hypothetical protein EHM48_00640 [Planctomycetaceae bacterium]|nr:MAG: hypothetical protein EHM48_00640 [Planctomycetaceae bacterium]